MVSYLRLPPEIWKLIFTFLSFPELLGAELVCSKFKNWIWWVDGPWSKMHSISFRLQFYNMILASVKRSGPQLDESEFSQVVEVRNALHRCAPLKELYVWCDSYIEPGVTQMVQFLDQLAPLAARSLSMLCWWSGGHHDYFLAQLLSLCCDTITQLTTTVCGKPLQVYDALHCCSILKSLWICTETSGLGGKEDLKSIWHLDKRTCQGINKTESCTWLNMSDELRNYLI